MKKVILFIFVLISYSPDIFAFAAKDSIMVRLDEVMAKKELYVKEKEQRILNLKNLQSFPDLSARQLYNLNQKIYKESIIFRFPISQGNTLSLSIRSTIRQHRS
jgi:hypothetical protein